MPLPDDPLTAMRMSDVSRIVSAALAPVVLINGAAILLSGFSAKYSAVSAQMRDLAREWRATGSAERRASLRRQLGLFDTRLRALWLANVLLTLALIAFVGTVFAVALAARAGRLDLFGAALLGVGLLLSGAAAVMVAVELRLARRTSTIELEDVLAPTAPGSPKPAAEELQE